MNSGMPYPASASTAFAENFVVWVTTLGAIAFAAAVLAYWTWAWLAPDARVATIDLAPRVATTRVADRLFGSPSAAATAIAAGPVQLLGIIATPHARQRGAARALLRIDGETHTVAEGQQLAGVRIVTIARDHLVVERDGRRETLSWPTAMPIATPSATSIAR